MPALLGVMARTDRPGTTTFPLGSSRLPMQPATSCGVLQSLGGGGGGRQLVGWVGWEADLEDCVRTKQATKADVDAWTVVFHFGSGRLTCSNPARRVALPRAGSQIRRRLRVISRGRVRLSQLELLDASTRPPHTQSPTHTHSASDHILYTFKHIGKSNRRRLSIMDHARTS